LQGRYAASHIVCVAAQALLELTRNPAGAGNEAAMTSRGWVVVIVPIATLSILATLGACAKTEQRSMQAASAPTAPQNPTPQGGQSGPFNWNYVDANVEWGSYTKVVLEPVTIWTDANSGIERLSPKEQKAFADALYTEIHNTISERCQVVTEPSPGTVVVRFALIDAAAEHATLNTVSGYEPNVRSLYVLAAKAFDDGIAAWIGADSFEGYGRDGATGKLLWKTVDERAGTRVRGWDTLSSWDDVDKVLKTLAVVSTRSIAVLGLCPGVPQFVEPIFKEPASASSLAGWSNVFALPFGIAWRPMLHGGPRKLLV
jgi:hypothetical protein